MERLYLTQRKAICVGLFYEKNDAITARKNGEAAERRSLFF